MTTPTWQTLRWTGDEDGRLYLIDQTRLPRECVEIECESVDGVWRSIRALQVRGAPAIGIAAAYGVVLGLQTTRNETTAALFDRLESVCTYLGSSRPTAVNLFWALDRMKQVAVSSSSESSTTIRQILLSEAIRIHDEDRAMCYAIGKHGAHLVRQHLAEQSLLHGDRVSMLTHCNAGGLATAEYGTALAVLFTLHDQLPATDKTLHVFVDETRPLLQGARLTAWELMAHGVACTLICDSMAAQVMREGKVDAVITGADRIASNGDTANKIGTYGLAVLARAHGIPFFVAAPSSTFDLSISSGAGIHIEQRSSDEVTQFAGNSIAPHGVAVYNPAFDVTPAELITGIITERGSVIPVNGEQISRIMKGP